MWLVRLWPFFVCDPGVGLLPYKDSTGMGRANAPPPPIRHRVLLKTERLYFFDLDRSKRPPFKKYTSLCSAFPTWADRKDPCFKKIYVSLLFLAPKAPVYPVSGRSEKSPFSVRGPLPKHPPHFKPCMAHIYTSFIFENPAPSRPPVCDRMFG